MAYEISIIIPAYNEEESIASVVDRVQAVLNEHNHSYEILVIDDGSLDKTGGKATQAGAQVITHPYNIGNGAAVKTGIRHAKGDLIVMMDGDGQHAPEDIPRLIGEMKTYDMVVGARTIESETHVHRDFANQIYNALASYVCGRKIRDLTSGFRAIKSDIARSFLFLLPNKFSYPSTITLAIVRSGYSLVYIPVKTSERIGKSKIRLIRDGSRFLLIILKISTFFSPLKVFLPASIIMFLLGFSYGLFKVIVLGSRYGPTSAMLMAMSFLVFLIGLISEQITQLRFDQSGYFLLEKSEVEDK